MSDKTFIIDCPACKAKVAAELCGVAEHRGNDYDTNEPFADRLYVGKCPRCNTLLSGKSSQMNFVEWGAEFDEWTDVVRVFPLPMRTFNSYRIPKVLTMSLAEADRCLQSCAPSAACVMLGRALEAMCRDILQQKSTNPVRKGTQQSQAKAISPAKKIMLGKGIKELKDRNVIDQRLYDWSQQLQAFRNVAAHPDEIEISREDAEDLQSFVYAIVEYVYDLADRYEEFKERLARRNKKAALKAKQHGGL
jgi:hypothetical protein